jgi:hypothetical protein
VNYPLAWFITWTTYGTWLHGDARGSFADRTYLPPNPELERANRSEMAGDAVYLTDPQRASVDATLVNECLAQGWQLHAHNVRTNHVHLVVSAARAGAFVRTRLKALASKALSDDAVLPMASDNGRKRWWTEKGNIIPIEDEKSLEGTTMYVRDLQ